jgi:hypothetical protein
MSRIKSLLNVKLGGTRVVLNDTVDFLNNVINALPVNDTATLAEIETARSTRSFLNADGTISVEKVMPLINKFIGMYTDDFIATLEDGETRVLKHRGVNTCATLFDGIVTLNEITLTRTGRKIEWRVVIGDGRPEYIGRYAA